MCDKFVKNKSSSGTNNIIPTKNNLKKELMILTVYQLMDNNLISPDNLNYKKFKELIQNKAIDHDDLIELYNNIIYDSIHNEMFNKEDTMKKILTIFEEVDHYKSEYSTTSKINKSKEIFKKLDDILIFPLL